MAHAQSSEILPSVLCNYEHPRSYAKSAEEHQWPVPYTSSSLLTLHKSTFQGFATRIPPTSLETQFARFFTHLTNTEPRIRRATHCMYAWRAGSDLGDSDGGESGAGERLSKLLELTHTENTLLVVYRWHGGVQLGSQRWKCISSVAKEALDGERLRDTVLQSDDKPVKETVRSKGKRRK